MDITCHLYTTITGGSACDSLGRRIWECVVIANSTEELEIVRCEEEYTWVTHVCHVLRR